MNKNLSKIVNAYSELTYKGEDPKKIRADFFEYVSKLHAVEDEYYDRTTDHWCVFESMQKMHLKYKANLRANEKKDFYYLITFTLDDKKNTKKKTNKEIEQYIHIQARRKRALHIEKASISQETHQDGRFHWHLALVTNKALRSDAFAYYIKLYGKVDIKPSKTYKSWDDLYGYISKENTPITLI